MPNMRWRARTGLPAARKNLVPQGAGLWVPYGTAYTALRHHADARAGETLLIHGASAAWACAVQWARALGLTVIGTAEHCAPGTREKRRRASRLRPHQSGYPEDILKAPADAV